MDENLYIRYYISMESQAVDYRLIVKYRFN